MTASQRFNQKIRVLQQIFREDDRKLLLELSKPYVVEKAGVHGVRYPGKQSWPPNLFQLSEKFGPYLQILQNNIQHVYGQQYYIQKSWVNWTNGKKRDMAWHNHPTSVLSAVYYLQTTRFFNQGTLFEHYGKVWAPQNSIVVFPSTLMHSAPSCILPLNRYTIALDIIERKNEEVIYIG